METLHLFYFSQKELMMKIPSAEVKESVFCGFFKVFINVIYCFTVIFLIFNHIEMKNDQE